jgi:hypothetical protein
MLLPDNVHPSQSIYYNGAFVLQAIQNNRETMLLELYIRTQKYCVMTLPVFVLCLDWLYLLNLVKLNDKGCIELCS